MAWENDKPTVVALREIASGLVDENVVQQEDIVETNRCSQRSTTRPTPRPKPWPRLDVACERRNPPGQG